MHARAGTAARLVATGMLSAVFACGETDEPRAPEPRRATAQVQPGEPQRAVASVRRAEQTATRPRATARLAPPPPRAAVEARARRLVPAHLEDALLEMSVEDAVRTLEEIQGPFDSAHYVFERSSEIEMEGRALPVDGAMSLLHCAFVDEGDPSLGRSLQVAGVRLEGAPEVFEGRIETHRWIEIQGRESPRSGRWRDLRERGGSLSGFGRLLDVEVDAVVGEETWVWRRELALDPERPSEVHRDDARSACPIELTLRLRVQEAIARWGWVERQGHHQLALVATEPGETLARATLVARRVSGRVEIFDPAQRVPRAVARLPAVAPQGAFRQRLP